MENILVGKTLIGIKLAEDKEAIRFDTAEGQIVVRVDADCCSHTWVESIELPAHGFPALVSAVQDLSMPDLGSPGDGDEIAYYGCKIVTDKGDIVIDYRNESNGYYGGSLSWPGDHFYGGVYGQNISEEKWVECK